MGWLSHGHRHWLNPAFSHRRVLGPAGTSLIRFPIGSWNSIEVSGTGQPVGLAKSSAPPRGEGCGTSYPSGSANSGHTFIPELGFGIPVGTETSEQLAGEVGLSFPGGAPDGHQSGTGMRC